MVAGVYYCKLEIVGSSHVISQHGNIRKNKKDITIRKRKTSLTLTKNSEKEYSSAPLIMIGRVWRMTNRIMNCHQI